MPDQPHLMSELRANFLDFASYAIPGGLLVLAALVATRSYCGCQPLGWIADNVLAPLGQTWRPVAGMAVLVLAAYTAGLVLKIFDDWLSSRGFVKRRVQTWTGEHTGACWNQLRKHASETLSLPAGEDGDESLDSLADTVVDMRAPTVAAWIERYSALGNCCAGLAWAVLASAGLLVFVPRADFGPLLTHSPTLSWPVIICAVLVFALLKWGQWDCDRERIGMTYGAAFRLLCADEPAAQAMPENGEPDAP